MTSPIERESRPYRTPKQWADMQNELTAWRGEVEHSRKLFDEQQGEINSLRSRIRELEEGLRPFAEALATADVSGQPIAYHIGVAPCQRAALLIKRGE